MKKVSGRLIAAVILFAFLVLSSGCAIVYYKKNVAPGRVTTEFGFLGFPEGLTEDPPVGGLLPVYRSETPWKSNN